MQGFLAKQGSPIPAEAFINTEDSLGCDSAVLVAITGADSSFGKHLATAHNPGNVGNNDRGDRIAYSSWQEGVDAICRVLNNKYLGQYRMIGELSNGGRRALGMPGCGACYATSQHNWNKNVLAYMRQLKGVAVNEKYIFRRS